MNMRTIALRAGVSSATVSRVINGSTAVSEETARRVRAVLDEVNFIPNPSATTLKYGRSKTYGLVIPDLCNPFFSEFLAAFEEALVQIDYELLLTSVQDSSSLMRSMRRMLMRQVDGAVLMGSEIDTEDIEPLLLKSIPLVTLDRRVIQPGCSDVGIDYQAGFSQAVKHLVELGHRRIGYIGGRAGLQTSRTREAAFCLAVRDAGLVVYPELTREGDYRVSGGEAAMHAMLQLGHPPTAVLNANDITAFGAALAMHRLGLEVPRDISLIGVDDVLLSQVMHPPLTTIRIPRRRLAQACVDALEYTKGQEGGAGARFVVSTELVKRESTSVPPARQATKHTTKRVR